MQNASETQRQEARQTERRERKAYAQAFHTYTASLQYLAVAWDSDASVGRLWAATQALETLLQKTSCLVGWQA